MTLDPTTPTTPTSPAPAADVDPIDAFVSALIDKAVPYVAPQISTVIQKQGVPAEIADPKAFQGASLLLELGVVALDIFTDIREARRALDAKK